MSAQVRIVVTTDNAGDVEVTQRSSRGRSYAETDAGMLPDVLAAAVAQVRAAYGLPGSKDVGRCTDIAERTGGPSAVCELNYGHTGAHRDADGSDWFRPDKGDR